MTKISLSAPGNPGDLASFLDGAFSFKHANRVIRLGFALAKTSGIDALEAAIAHRSEWSDSRKDWLVSTQFGLTEPEALHRLLDMPMSQVRLHGWASAPRSLRNSMFGAGNFHAKIIVSGPTNPARATALFIGSANLTGSALGLVPMNYEAGLFIMSPGIPPVLLKSLNDWWKRAWNESFLLTHAAVDDYARTREKVLRSNPDLKRFAGSSARHGPAFGDTLWIFSGAMSGGPPRYQIEFAQELAPFFGRLARHRRYLRIRHQGRIWDDRPLSYKVTTFGVEIWRLGLPTQASGGSEYANRVLHFKRSKDATGPVFDLTVADPNSPACGRWRRTSEVRGHVGSTGGGREYGLA